MKMSRPCDARTDRGRTLCKDLEPYRGAGVSDSSHMTDIPDGPAPCPECESVDENRRLHSLIPEGRAGGVVGVTAIFRQLSTVYELVKGKLLIQKPLDTSTY
jgi:hypothetical protein